VRRALIVVLLAVSTWALAQGQQPAAQTAAAAPGAPLSDPFATGWIVADTNGDGIADAVTGKIVLPANPTAAENAAAANLAARVAYGSTGLTLPLVVTAPGPSSGPVIWVGRAAPESVSAEVRAVAGTLAAGEGGVFAAGANLAVVGDDAGLGAAADGLSARAPYQWRVPGDKFSAIADAVNAAGHGSASQLIGVTYMRGEQGIHRALVRAGFAVTATGLTAAFNATPSTVSAVRQLVVVGGKAAVTAPNPKPLGAAAAPSGTAANGAAGADAPAGEAGGAGGAGAATRLDLATLYTSKGLFTGSARMPLPSSSDAHLYVPPGAAGVAMANLAARMGLETTGITLPIASPAADANARQVRTQAVIAGDSPLAQEVEKKLRDEDTAAAQAEPTLAAAEGELRVVDGSFGRRGAILVRGDQAGSAAAVDLLSGHFPNVWEPGKPYQSLEEIRYDLHRFFSLRSGAGQASAELYTLAQWMKEIKQSGVAISNVKAELYADLADPGLGAFVQKQLQQELGVSATVKAGSLRAGTQCCDQVPNLHFETPGYPYHQGTPTFAEDLVIPWEGTRLLNAVQGAASKVKAGQDVKLLARVSEGLEQRQKLQARIEEMLTKEGADKRRVHVEVLCAFKPGLSWLMDEIAPDLAGKGAAAIQVEFAKDVDPSGTRTMYSPSRWLHELYPVDEMLALKLKMSREKITFSMFEPNKGGPTYRVRATDGAGTELLSREFTVPTVMQPYNGVIKSYEQVEVDTGWVRMDVGADKVLDQRIMTDLEMFWDHYQNKTLPDVYQYVMSQAHGNMRDEFVPPFDTLKMDIHMSEPEYQIAGVDHERVSALEALQEDTFYSTANFVEMWGRLETGQQTNYTGRIIPVVHPPAADEGKDGHVRIEFYAKQAANPLVRLAWTDPQGKAQVRERAIPVLTGDMMPRLIQAQTKAGSDAIENLTWLLPADYKKDDFDNWSKVERRDQVDRTIFSVEKASGELHWLEQMHAAGIYRDSLAYQHVRKMGVEFELPLEINKETAPAERSYVSWSVPAPATPRPMITDYAGKVTHTPIVQWDEPIDSAENAGILARFSTFPGVTVYWMGRSYLGQNIWAADILLPSPSALHSWAKESTLKASVVYSGRQHANEVSSTSHINKLAEQLLTDPSVRPNLKQVNVVIHPITNPDGAELSVILAKITPDNMLHPGYHGSLSADVASNQTDVDPVYPESRTRKQLADAWLPDAFLNPHGYPSHEWVQPFSEYTGWVTNRQGANPSRANWIARGWFTSLGYFRDPDLPYSKLVAYTLQDQIVAAERAVPGLLPLETNMVDRYRRWAHDWQPEDVADSVVNGITMNMALKGTARGGGRGGAPGSGGIGGLSPDITWDAGYTEAPDETAHGDYMKLLASAGLAFDKVHLHYLANGTLRITRTERDVPGGVQRRFDRARPILPASVKPPATDR
jgi:hypothetical protein